MFNIHCRRACASGSARGDRCFLLFPRQTNWCSAAAGRESAALAALGLHSGGLVGTIWQALIKFSSPRACACRCRQQRRATNRNDTDDKAAEITGGTLCRFNGTIRLSSWAFSERRRDYLESRAFLIFIHMMQSRHARERPPREDSRRVLPLSSTRWNCSVSLICADSFSPAYSLTLVRRSVWREDIAVFLIFTAKRITLILWVIFILFGGNRYLWYKRVASIHSPR